MIIHAFKDLLVKNYENHKVYIHNLSNFDGIFLLKTLVKLSYCQPTIHKDRIISIQLNYGDYVIFLRDSQQLLIGSLRNLSKSFNVETLKGIFPYTFVNENNIDYIGEIPNIKFFDGVPSLDYNCYIENYDI
jgi:DNA polymerase type B, organellar and viral